MVVDEGGVEPLGVPAHPLHQFGALDPVRVAGPVVHLGGGHELPSRLQAGYRAPVEVGPGGIDGGGISGRSGAENKQAVVGLFHG